VPAATNLYRRLLNPDVWTNSSGETTPIEDLTLGTPSEHHPLRHRGEEEDPAPYVAAPARITHLNNLELDDEYAAQRRAYADNDCTDPRVSAATRAHMASYLQQLRFLS